MFVYEIPEQNLSELTTRFEKMVNRARKCKTVAPTFAIIHEADEIVKAREIVEDGEDPQDIEKIQRFFYVTLDGVLPKVKDWQFVATIDHTNETGNIIRNVPGMGDIPVAYRQASPSCEHCGHNRQRHETFVLKNAKGEFKQVGRNCLADFFDGELADYVVSLTELWESLGEMMAGMGESCGREIPRYSVYGVLTLTQEVILQRGWLSKAKARELTTEDGFGPAATSSWVDELLTPRKNWSKSAEKLAGEIKVAQLDRAENDTTLDDMSEAALEWARSLDPEGDSDYLYNLHVISKGESVDHKGLGLLCSLIPAYRRTIEEYRAKEAKPVSNHIGEEGVRQLFQDVKVEWIGQPSYSQWGATTPVKFVDSVGNVIMLWHAGEVDPQEYEVGKTVSIVGTVKSHTRFNGDAQTVINRVKAWDGKPVKQAKKKK